MRVKKNTIGTKSKNKTPFRACRSSPHVPGARALFTVHRQACRTRCSYLGTLPFLGTMVDRGSSWHLLRGQPPACSRRRGSYGGPMGLAEPEGASSAEGASSQVFTRPYFFVFIFGPPSRTLLSSNLQTLDVGSCFVSLDRFMLSRYRLSLPALATSDYSQYTPAAHVAIIRLTHRHDAPSSLPSLR